jgi:hypothetical protein
MEPDTRQLIEVIEPQFGPELVRAWKQNWYRRDSVWRTGLRGHKYEFRTNWKDFTITLRRDPDDGSWVGFFGTESKTFTYVYGGSITDTIHSLHYCMERFLKKLTKEVENIIQETYQNRRDQSSEQ